MLDFIKAGRNLLYFIVRDIQRWRKAQPSDSTAPPMDFLGLHSPGIKMEGDSPQPIQDLRLNDLIACLDTYLASLLLVFSCFLANLMSLD